MTGSKGAECQPSTHSGHSGELLMLKYVPVLLLGLFTSTAVLGQSIDDRVRDLERRVQQLEKQSAQQSASAPSRSQIAGGQERWKQVENWRSLKRGMTEADVRSLLGEPYKVQATGRFTVWTYEPSGEVLFSPEGRVGAWT